MLAGAAVSSLTAAGIALALNFAPNPYAAYEIMTWLLGSLADKSWTQVWLVLPFVSLGGCGLLALTGRALDALALGEAQAHSLGINLSRLAALVVAGTALSGGRDHVGHRRHRLHRPGGAASGAALCGLSARAGFCCRPRWRARCCCCAPTSPRGWCTPIPELRLGVFTSLLGTPFFFWLVVRMRKVAP